MIKSRKNDKETFNFEECKALIKHHSVKKHTLKHFIYFDACFINSNKEEKNTSNEYYKVS